MSAIANASGSLTDPSPIDMSAGAEPSAPFPGRLIVTGTSGFVGGAIGRHMRGLGWHVAGISRRSPRVRATDVALRHDLADALPPDALGSALGSEPYDAIVHAAALSAPWGRPAAFERANVTATANVLELAGRVRARLVVLISSSSVLYDWGDQRDLPERAAPSTPAINAYAATKREAERLVREGSIPSVILRPRAVFGVGDTVLFPRLARAARLRLLPRLQRDDGVEPEGDLVSIDNLVRFTARAVEREARGVLHLTDGAPVRIGAFVGDALGRCGLPAPVRTIGEARAMRLAAALEAVSRRTGWWEPPLTRYGVSVFTRTKTFSTERAREVLGTPEVPTEIALARFAAWWRRGGSLDDPTLGHVGRLPDVPPGAVP